jgi:hypothetical protein
MRGALCTLAGIAFCCLAACNNSKPTTPSATAAAPDPARITQFYATQPRLPRGEKELLCYGVENAKTVWLAPPRQELSAALSRCVEVNPTATTTYTLTAEGAGGPAATKDLTVTLGGERVKIVDVTVSALSVKAGDTVSICVHTKGAASVEVDPLHFRTAHRAESCTLDHPKQTTTYAVTATGVDGDQDHERVTVKVQ